MNFKRLKQAESDFLLQYPGGFQHPDMVLLGKKHKMDKMIEMSQKAFNKASFERHSAIVDDMVNVVSRSSMVSMFEKPKFKSFTKTLTALEKELLIHGLEERLHGNEQHGFEMISDVLTTGKIAKWTLISIIPVCFHPNFDVFIKPTTVKGIIDVLEIKQLKYKPTPTWEFYKIFRDQINEMKSNVDPTLSPNNAAFTGFLMMSLF